MPCRLPESQPRRLGAGLLAGLLALGVSACADDGADTASVQPLPPRSQPPAPSPQPPHQPLIDTAGLTPLASSQQLLGSVVIGRLDPFASLQPATPRATAGSAPVASPENVHLLGVISSGRTAQAMVQIGDRTGALCQGPRGRCPGRDSLSLPPGWSVERIAAGQGLLVVRHGSQRLLFSVVPRLS